MEPPRKRQRLLEPTLESNQSAEELESYLDNENHEDEDDYEEFDEDEDEVFDYGESDLVNYDFGNRSQGFDLAERRARVDQKLKSNWEMLFEKFSKDFTGIGDEIDLATGEIVVDNGHLKSMQDERDIGYSVSGRSLLRALTVEPEGLSTLVPLSEGADGADGEYSGSASHDEDENLEEDTVRASTEIHQEIEDSSAPEDVHTPRQDLWNTAQTIENSTPATGQEKVLPSREEILERFGELGPKVIQLLDQQQGSSKQDNIEPAWRVPELPSRVSGKRPSLQSVFLQETDDERSPSPERGTSLWAVLEGQSQKESKKKKRVQFTELEDEILLAEITKAKKQGVRIDKGKVYADIAAAYPRHSEKEWYDRWYRTRRMPGMKHAMSLGATPDEIKEWKFDGLEWISKDPAHHTMSPDLHASRTVEYVKRVIRTERPGTGEYQDTDVHTFMGVIISEKDQKRTKALRPMPHRFQELSSHQLGSEISPFQHEDNVPLGSSPRSMPILTGEQLPRTPIPTKRPHWQISWNEHSAQSSTKSHNDLQKSGGSDSPMSPNMETSTTRTASEDLFEKLKDLHARPVRSKNIASLQLAPGEQHISGSEGGHEYHVRLLPCPHRDCQDSSKLYKAARTNKDDLKCEFDMHLRDEHDFSMYPCLEVGCRRKGRNGFRNPGKLIAHVKAAHNRTRALLRLQKVIDKKTLASKGIYFDEQTVDPASTADAVDELQDESSGLGIQLGPIHDENLPQRSLPGNSSNEPMQGDDQDVEPVEPAMDASSPKHLLKDNLLTMRQSEPPGGNEDPIVTADQAPSPQIVLRRTTRSSAMRNERAKAKIHDIPSDLTSFPKISVPFSTPEGEDEILATDSHISSSIGNSSPMQRYSLRSGIVNLPKRPRTANTSTKPISNQPDIPDSTAVSSPLPDTLTSQPKSSPKTPFINAPRRSSPLAIADSDEPDELSIISPALYPSLMSCRAITTISRTPSRVSSPFNPRHPPHPSSTPQKKRSTAQPRHSLPMSAIPPRSIQKTSRKSLSGYNYKAPSSSLRRMMMPSTPTKNRKKNVNGGMGDGDVEEGEVFKTPGGTVRRCGQEGFVCGREFCFRCVGDRE